MNVEDTEDGLNSTMVRLKQNEYDPTLIYAKRSQFHYGSIKTYTQSEIFSLCVLSQFHYGSIKTFIN